MQRIQQKKEEVWAESQEILKEISEIQTENQLISRLQALQKLQENAAFLKIAATLSDENSATALHAPEPQINDIEDQLDLEEAALPEPLLEKLDEEYFASQPVETEPVNPETTFAEEVLEAEEELIIEETAEPADAQPKTEDQGKPHKIKLAHIKGLHVESLFGDDGIQHPSIPVQENAAKDNAEKQKQDFKLDLNDRMAFSKMLFDGSQADLNETIRRLNTYPTLNEAKQYLSEVYYERNWKKADEYAQRLWGLVEHKFL